VTDQDRIEAFIKAHPKLDRIELLFPDMNGVMRGKWLPGDAARKLLGDGIRLPMSTYALDIFGEDVDETQLAAPIGDPDGIARPVLNTLKPIPWSEDAAQVLMTMQEPNGSGCLYDPRTRLAAQVERLERIGITPVVATELEFYVFQAGGRAGDAPMPPPGLEGAQVYDLAATTALEPMLDDILEFCDIQDIPADTLIAEFGPGQFEINFNHIPDAMAAADHAMLFKRLVKAAARKHGVAATFMAKPYGDPPGSGMHVHVSLLDKEGRNVFAAEGGLASPLNHAIGGLLGSMRELQAVFAPHANSYRRFQPGSYAPMALNWGLDHRGVAVRVPATSGAGARLEHRICGADVNPYLALAAILGGIAHGLENKLSSGPALTDGDGSDGERLHHDWTSALDEFEGSALARSIYSDEYVRVYTACRRAEVAKLATMISDAEYKTYLHKL
jgi:glutamine synthetase